MGKTSVTSQMKKNDKSRKFPPLGQPLTEEQQKELNEALGRVFQKQ